MKFVLAYMRCLYPIGVIFKQLTLQFDLNRIRKFRGWNKIDSKGIRYFEAIKEWEINVGIGRNTWDSLISRLLDVVALQSRIAF